MGLADLNTYSEQQIEFTDNRDATVLFLSPQAADLEFTATGTSFSVNNPYNIDEIIRPEVCLPTFSVDVSGLSGATVAWSIYPAGSTVTVSNGVYTIDNIVDADTYDVVKTPTITVPSDFQGSFFYTVRVNYTDSVGLQSYEWQVGAFVPVSNLSAQFTQTVSPIKIKGSLPIELVSRFTLLGGGFEFDIAEADFASSFNMVSNVSRPFRGFSSTQSVDTNIAASGSYGFAGLSSSLSANATVTTNATKIDSVTGYNSVLSYTGNAENANIFNGITFNATSTPVGTNHRVVITVTGGKISTGNFGDNLSTVIDNNYDTAVGLDGATQVQSLVNGISFFPTHNSTSTATYTVDYYINNSLVIDGATTNINYSGTTATVQELWFTRQYQEKFPNYSRMYHNKVDFHLFGGGGGGANDVAGGGGGAGNYETLIGYDYIEGSVGNANNGYPYNITSGSGGAWGGGSYSIANAGAQGSSTTFWYDPNGTYGSAVLTIEPGYGGGDGSNNPGIKQGSNTQGSTFTGGNGFSTTISGTLHSAGGQGAGATGDGADAYTYNNGQNLAGGTGNNGIVLNSVQYAQGGKGQSTHTPTFRSDARTMGSGGNGGADNVNGRGADGGAVIRMYRV